MAPLRTRLLLALILFGPVLTLTQSNNTSNNLLIAETLPAVDSSENKTSNFNLNSVNTSESSSVKSKVSANKFTNNFQGELNADSSQITFPSLNDYEQLNFNPEHVQDDFDIQSGRRKSGNDAKNDINKIDKKSLKRIKRNAAADEKIKTDCVFHPSLNRNDQHKRYLRRKIFKDRYEHLTRRKRYVVCGSSQYRYRQIPNCVGWTYYRPYPVNANCEPAPSYTYSGSAKTWLGPKYGESFIAVLSE